MHVVERHPAPPLEGAKPPALLHRILVASAIGLVLGWLAWYCEPTLNGAPDFGQIWFAAREVVAGRSPYLAIGPGLAYDWPAPLYYPLPAVLLALPFAGLPLRMAVAAFSALSCAVLAFALTRTGWVRLPLFCSMAATIAAVWGQWTFLVAAAALTPALGFILTAKPTIGAGAFMYRPSWPAIGGGAALIAVSFMIQPGWFAEWLEATSRAVPHFAVNTDAAEALGATTPYFAPVSRFGGILLPLALVRWRRPEARLLMALSLVPQTMVLYECVLLYLIPSTLGESAALALLSYVAYAAPWLAVRVAGLPEMLKEQGAWIVLCQYLPCLWMVVRRPNVGDVPAWIDRMAVRAESAAGF